MTSATVDFLIIGAGPAGLVSAYNLSQAGFDVRIVDKKPKRLEKGQGDVFQVRGMEIVDSLGLASQILEGAQRCSHTATYESTPTSNGEISLVSRKSIVHGIDTNMPFMGMFPQSSLEGILREALASGTKHVPSATFSPQSQPLGPPGKVQVEQGVFPVEMKVADAQASERYPVTVRLVHPDGQIEIVRAQYLLGCDGAHSWTRSQLGIETVGETSSQVWGVVDGYVNTDFPDIRTLTTFDNNGRHAMLVPREGDMVRFTIQVPQSDVSIDPVTGRVDRTKITEDRMVELVKDLIKPYRVDFNRGLYWSGVYVIGQRLATRYQDKSGRVFILGDACHTHSPHAGQGMNAAISDAHNLSWKLVHVLKGWAMPDLLDTVGLNVYMLRFAFNKEMGSQYESERRGFAAQLIELHQRIAEFNAGKVEGTSSDYMIKSMGFVRCTTSGVGTRYSASGIVDPSNQRFPHHVILRTADFRARSTLDLFKSDNIYKIVILTGDVKDTVQKQKLEEMGKSLNQWFLQRPSVFQVYTIMAAKKETASYTDVPESLRPYWDTVFLDDIAYARQEGGGKAYESFGVGPEGCMALVRPDGHVAALAPLKGEHVVEALCSVKVPLNN
ncbi:unnamed protein product [Rhizoctonia solani]|uniref:Phenol 2-monooxygenase n=1 Tax=Rhizoctonia solani TaxID=456999 RepID=A0A8H3B533_9AGAM|nr:unnamed protein product [Rhizoctonia solani]